MITFLPTDRGQIALNQITRLHGLDRQGRRAADTADGDQYKVDDAVLERTKRGADTALHNPLKRPAEQGFGAIFGPESSQWLDS
jgi:hypothetical protein